MKIYLRRVNEAVCFEASNARGHKVFIDGSRKFGGQDAGPSPTEYLLMSQAGCTAIDVVELLKKMHQPLRHIELEAEAQRAEDRVPKVFTHIHIHYRIFGSVKPEKAEKAISLSIEKYCTVSKMIDHLVRITHSFEIIDETDQAIEETTND